VTELWKQAVEYQQRGYFVVPVRIVLVQTKQGLKKEIDYAGESWSTYVLPDDPATVELHFSTGFGKYEGGVRNLPATGFVFDCGRSGIVVPETDIKGGVDGADNLKAAGITLDTPAVVVSQSGGLHHYYRSDPVTEVRNSASKLAANVDVRGSGGVIVGPGSWVEGGGRYELFAAGDYLPFVSDLPVIPADFLAWVQSVQPRKSTVAVEFDPDWVQPQLTKQQRAVGSRIAKAKLAQIREAKPTQRNEVLKVTVPRIVGIAKTMGADLDRVGDLIRDAYYASGGDDDRQLEDWIRNATAKAVPDDHSLWDTDPDSTLPDTEFWECRPELAYIRDAALEATASPWAVLGALVPRVLSGVPVNWTLDTKVGTSRGNLNTFSVLAADSGGGKGLASEVAEYLWPVDTDVLVTDTASGEALARLFANRDMFVRSSAIIDVDEYAALRASADRSGSTLAFKLSTAWSGKALSLTYADESRNVNVPAGSYRLGMVAGIQYGNAKMLLSASDQIQGYAKRFMWFPAEIDYEPNPEAASTFPAPMTVPVFDAFRAVSIKVPAEVTAIMRRARIGGSGLDGHSLYARIKLAYALAVLNGRTDRVSVEDWELSGVGAAVSERTQAKARDAMKARRLSENRSRGEMDGVRQSAADESAHAQALVRVRRLVEKHKAENPSITNGAVRRKLAGRDLKLFDELYPKPS
jgi:hypothetical protein